MSFASSEHTTVALAQKYIDKHYLEDISLDDIAAACHVSKTHLSHVFEDIKNMTVISYVRRKRFQISEDLLINSDLPISVVAEKSGFPNANYFSRIFMAEYNITPRQYRKQANTIK